MQAPLQPTNTESMAGVAVRVTTVAEANLVLHVVPQSIPAGLDTTAPVPLPDFETESVYALAKVAATDLAASITT